MANKKTFILDTNIFISDPDCLEAFDDNEIIIPTIVIEELDNNKSSLGDKGYNVRKALRNIEKLRLMGSLRDGILLENGGSITVMDSNDIELDSSLDTFAAGLDRTKADNQIITLAIAVRDDKEKDVYIISNDTGVRIKADVYGIKSQEYKHERVSDDYLDYDGRTSVYISDIYFKEYIEKGYVDAKAVLDNENNGEVDLSNNCFLILINEVTGGTMLGMYKNGVISKLSTSEEHPYDIIPRNSGQSFAIEALMKDPDEIPLVILKGNAGCAKTFITLACGLELVAEKKQYRKMTITRANVEFDKDIGALPGDEEEKISPLLRGCMDNLELLVDYKGVKGTENTSEEEINDKVEELFNRGYIDAQALGFLRGRSLTRQFLYVDEAQNTSISQMKGILTRVGEGTKLVIAGDLNQIDNPRLDRHNNGLAYAIKLMKGDPLCAIVGFTENEAVRSPLAQRVATKIAE